MSDAVSRVDHHASQKPCKTDSRENIPMSQHNTQQADKTEIELDACVPVLKCTLGVERQHGLDGDINPSKLVRLKHHLDG